MASPVPRQIKPMVATLSHIPILPCMGKLIFTGKRLLFHCEKNFNQYLAIRHFRLPIYYVFNQKIICLTATSQYKINIQHIHGIDNTVVDRLSCLQLRIVYNLVPAAHINATTLPPVAWDGILNRKPLFFPFMTLSKSSQKTYSTGEPHFANFCNHLNIPRYPLQETTLRLFASFLAKTLSFQTILAAIRFHHIQLYIQVISAFVSFRVQRFWSGGRTGRLPISYCPYLKERGYYDMFCF